MASSENRVYFSTRYCYPGEQEIVASILDIFDGGKADICSINCVLELYNAKICMDSNDEIKSWSTEKYSNYKRIAGKVLRTVKSFFDTLDESNIIENYIVCDDSFWEDFWQLFFLYKVYERISKSSIIPIIQKLSPAPNTLFKNKEFVSYFDDELSILLKMPHYGAKIVVNHFLGSGKKIKLYFPKAFGSKERVDVIKNYINDKEVNPRDLELIMYSPCSSDLPIDDVTRYKAKKRYEEFWRNSDTKTEFGGIDISVAFQPNTKDIADVTFKDKTITAEYDLNWIINNQDYPTLLNNFIYLFQFTDSQMRCTLVNNACSRDVIEELFITEGKTMYKYGHSFKVINSLSDMQLMGYYDILAKENIWIEEVLKWFYEEYLHNEFMIEGFELRIPAFDREQWEKCKLISSCMDGIIKQFKMYVEYGEIDRELYEMTSSSIKNCDIPSFVKYKYGYIDSNELQKEVYFLFSNQSLLSYTEKTEDKHNTLFSLLCNEELQLTDFHKRQHDDLNWLLERKSVVYNDKGYLKLNKQRVYVLKQLFENEVICLQYSGSDVVKSLVMSGEIKTEGKLLSRLEYEYFDFILNKAEYSNGLDLRNRYIHDTCSSDVTQQKQDYINLLKIMIILTIKINEEFCLKDNQIYFDE